MSKRAVGRVALLGSTGSIGTQTIEVAQATSDRFEIVALGAANSVDLLVEQAEAVRPEVVAIANAERASELRERLDPSVEVLAGPTAMADAAEAGDTVINGVVGFAGLPVTLGALAAGKRLALANKESLIAAGPVVAKVRNTPGAELIPVDSEHCAIHMCLRSNEHFAEGKADRVDRLILTASGGPFRGKSTEELADVTIDDALAHPTWSMGAKITIDSSTLMNKGLEVIEAHELFGLGYDAIEVVVHRQSIIHSMVEFSDGATIAQLSLPDMRLPIGYALAFPDRVETPFGRIDWAELSRLDFEPPDLEAFPCLGLAYAAGRAGGAAPAWLNAANEVAVEAFLAGRISWVAIAEVLEQVLDGFVQVPMDSVEDVIDVDGRARVAATAAIESRASKPKNGGRQEPRNGGRQEQGVIA